MLLKIPFNKPYLTGNELKYINNAVESLKISGNGYYTKKCHSFFEENYNIKKCLLTTSCTDALEMAAILIDIQPGDEVIVPSFTFVSTANAFVLRGAKVVFCDSRPDHPGIDESKIEALITPKTKAIIPVHYAGVACDMDKIMEIANRHEIFVIEDAAQAIDSYYVNSRNERVPLGSIGHLAAFSFHETKNIIAGEGGMLAINDERFIERAEIIWEKGTNRAAFWRGEVDKYNWIDIGSSFLPSEIIAAFLWAQLENLDKIQKKRISIWEQYYDQLSKFNTDKAVLPAIPGYATNNGHLFYLVLKGAEQRDKLIFELKSKGIFTVFHYISLHRSPFYKELSGGDEVLPYSDKFSNGLLRLPLFYELESSEVTATVNSIFNLLHEKI